MKKTDYKEFTDQELTALFKESDHLAFSEIYNRYWRKLLLIAFNHTKNRAVAKDIVNEVFTDLWDRRAILEIREIAKFLSTSIKFSIFKNFRQESRRAELLEGNYVFNEASDDVEKLDARFLKDYISGVVEEMPEKCKLVFRYSREMGLKNSEIAEKINVTEKGVEATLTRALKIIRGELKNYGLTILYLLYYFHSR